MNNFSLIEKYTVTAVDKFFIADSKTAILEEGQKFINVDFKETGYVKIASILMDGLSDYYQTQQNSNGFVNPATGRPTDPENYAAYAGNLGTGERDGFAIGGVSLKWEIFRLQYCRGRQFRIDYIANEETAGVMISNLIGEFVRTKVIPEVDVSRFSILADQSSISLGNRKVDTIASNTIIGNLNSAFEWLAEHEVPVEDQIIFVSEPVMTLIRNTNELTKFLTQEDYKRGDGIDFTVTMYAGRPLIPVPSNRFFTNVLLGSNGYRATSDSKIINYMVVSKRAVVPIKKVEWSKLYDENLSGLAGFHGYLYNFLIYHGVVVPENKLAGVFVSVSEVSATTKTDLLSVDTVAGAVQYGWKLNRYFTQPAGLRGYVVYNYSTAFTLGSAISSVGTVGENYFIAEIGAEQSATSTQTTAYFALVDATGTIIATSGSNAVTLVRHA